MNYKLLRLTALLAAPIACLFFTQQASAQSAQYYYPAPNYGYHQTVQPYTPYFSSPRSTSYRSYPRPVTGYGANIHRNFTIKQELLRAQRTGRRVRNKGNVLWSR